MGMNGFIFYSKEWGKCTPDAKRVAPIDEDCSCEIRKFSNGETLITWGRGSGDVIISEQGEKSVLILSGYIAEYGTGLVFKNQVDAAKYLLRQIEENSSAEALKDICNNAYGSFSIVYRDMVLDETICMTDRISSRPLWYRMKGTSWILSSHAMAVALSVQPMKYELAGLGAFFLYGGPVDASVSLFKDVYGVNAGTIMRIAKNSGCEETGWYKFEHKPDTNLSRYEWAKLAADRIVRAAGRIGKNCNKPAIFFSGGADSRLTASAMKVAGINPFLITLSDSKNIEVHVAQLAAKALGLDHIVIMRDKHWYLRTLQHAIYETGGHYLWTHGHFSSAADKLQFKYGIDTFLLGDLCEAFSKLLCTINSNDNTRWTSETFISSFDSIRLPLYRPIDRQKTLNLFNRRKRTEISDCIRDTIRKRFQEISRHAEDPLIVGDLSFRWGKVATSPTYFMFLDLRSRASERNLMFDKDIHALLELLPSKMRNSDNMGARMINHLQPMSSWVLNSNSLLPMIFPSGIHKFSKRIKPIFGHLRRAIIGRSHTTTGSWPENAVLYINDVEWRGCIETTLNNESLFDEEIFDLREIRKCWQEFKDGNFRRISDVEKIFQVGKLAELFKTGASDFVQCDQKHEMM